MDLKYLNFRVLAFVCSAAILPRPERWLNVWFWWIMAVGVVELILVARARLFLVYHQRMLLLHEIGQIIIGLLGCIGYHLSGDDASAAYCVAVALTAVCFQVPLDVLVTLAHRRWPLEIDDRLLARAHEKRRPRG